MNVGNFRASHYLAATFFLLACLCRPAWAGPPYFTDDPEPTELGHYEIYLFNAGTNTRDGTAGTAGIDFNYGGAKDLQLTVVLPIGYEHGASGLGNVELAAKYRILHQDDVGWDIAVFPRVFLPSGSHAIGERHASFLLPVWIGKSWDKWSTFGGGGCVLNHGGPSKNFCLVGWAITREVLPGLELGGEVFHKSADTIGEHATTGLGFGVQYTLNEHLHLIGSLGPGIQNAAETNRYSWYAALLLTF